MGGIVIVIGFIQLFRLFRNSKRPKLDATINKIEDKHLEQDKNNQFKKHPHAEITYYYSSVKYTASVLIKDKTKQVMDQIEITYLENPSSQHGEPTKLEMYAPKKEFLMAMSIIAVGCIIVGICHFIMTYFDLW